MARRNPARERALAEAKAAERRAGNKVYRNEAAGRHIRGTEYDPRVGAAKLTELGTRDLRALTRKLNAFNSRETQFTGLFAGRPVPRETWMKYKNLEQAQNQQAQAIEQAIASVKMPGQDQTVGQYIGMNTAGNQAATNQQSRIFHQINRSPETIVDPKSLNTLIETMRKKNDPAYLKDAVDKRMNSIYALLRGSGLEDRIAELEGLSLREKQALLDYSNFTELARERFGSGDDEIEDQSKIDQDWIERGEDRAEYVNQEMTRTLNWIKDSVARRLVEISATTNRKKW